MRGEWLSRLIKMLELIIGVGIVSFLLFYLAFNLDNDHVFLKLLLIGCSIFLLIYIPADTLETCEVVGNYTNNVYSYGENYSEYHWDYDYTLNPSESNVRLFHNKEYNSFERVCFENSAKSLSFYNSFLWVLRLFMTYFFLYFTYLALDFLGYSTGIKEYISSRVRKK